MAETEAETAARLGLGKPWVSGPQAGQCPGGATYGRGLSEVSVHAGGCCASWAQARAEAETGAEAG